MSSRSVILVRSQLGSRRRLKTRTGKYIRLVKFGDGAAYAFRERQRIGSYACHHRGGVAARMSAWRGLRRAGYANLLGRQTR